MKLAETIRPDVSIVTCSYNQNRFLSSTIESVISQSGVAVEYLIIDGGSADGSVETISKYANQLSGWVSEPDRGQSDALNKGLRRVAGDIVGWLCSDDVLLPHALARVVELFKQHPEVDAIYGNAVLIDTVGNIMRPKREIGFYPWLMIGDHNYIPQPAMFWRRSVHDKLGYLREELHYTMDLELWLRFGKAGLRVLHVDEYFAGMRCHENQKVLVHPVDLARENAELRALYQPAWSKRVPQRLWRMAARTARIVLKVMVGGYTQRAPAVLAEDLYELHQSH